MKRIYFSLAFVFIFILMALSISAFDIAIEDENGNIYYHDSYKFYLPSHIKPDSVKVLVGNGNTLSYADNKISSSATIDITPHALRTENETIYGVPIMLNGYDSYINVRFASNLPSVYVQTALGEEYIIKYGYEDTGAHATITKNDGTIEFKDTVGNSKFKIRGNTTKDYAKKPFQLKLSEKSDIFGMGESKTWILLANYLDQSLLRNSIMYEIGKHLGMQTSDFTNVDLYVNGNYYGIYLMCEKVQISKTRLDIYELEKDNDLLNSTYKQYATRVTSGELIDSTILTEYCYIDGVANPSDITGGYLIELDNNYYKNELCYFTTENGNHYVVKSPEYASRQEVEYIARLFAEMEEAIMSSSGYNSLNKHYTEYIDIDSFAAAYIVAELGRNYDAGSSSMYFYKDRDVDGQTSKIFKGPLWDCDNTLGNIHKNSASSTEGYWAKNRSIWSGLTAKSEFNRIVTKKFENAYNFIFDMIDKGGFVDKEIEKLGSSVYMEQKRWGSNDYSKWPLYYDGTHYDKWQSSPVFNFVSVYSQGNNEDLSTVIGYLCEHIEARTNWLATEWDCNVTLRERDFTAPVIPEPNPEPDEDVSTDAESSTETESDTETSVDTETETEINTETDVDAETETDTETGVDTETETDTETEVDTETNTDTDTSTESETDTEVDTEANTDTDTSTESEIETEVDTEDEEPENQPENDMTPDFEEPPAIDDMPQDIAPDEEPTDEKPRSGFFAWIFNALKGIMNFLRSIIGLPKV